MTNNHSPSEILTVLSILAGAGSAVLSGLLSALITSRFSRRANLETIRFNTEINKKTLETNLRSKKAELLSGIMHKNLEYYRMISKDAYFVVGEIEATFSYGRVMFSIKDKEYKAVNVSDLIIKEYDTAKEYLKQIKYIEYSLNVLREKKEDLTHGLYTSIGTYVTALEQLMNPNKIDRDQSQLDKIFGELLKSSEDIQQKSGRIKNILLESCRTYEGNIKENLENLRAIS